MGAGTSHMTGNIARLGVNVAEHDYRAAIAALALVFAFFLGAFSSSLILQSHDRPSPRSYALALSLETLLLIAFMLLEGKTHGWLGARFADSKASILCFAMGLQNSLVTFISGARVRTTHLTGVVTDLGIEVARWFRWHRWVISNAAGLGRFGGTKMAPPERANLLLHVTIIAAYLIGSVSGASLASIFLSRALAAPALATLAAGLYAVRTERRLRD